MRSVHGNLQQILDWASRQRLALRSPTCRWMNCTMLLVAVLLAGCTKSAQQRHTLPVSVIEAIASARTQSDLFVNTKTIPLLTPDTVFIGDVHSIAVTAEGSICLIDAANSSPSVFDSTGRYRFQLGRRGAGPGELRRPTAVTYDEPRRQWIVADGPLRKLQLFDDEGRALKSFAIKGNVHSLLVNSRGDYLLFMPTLAFASSGHLVTRLDYTGNLVSRFYEPSGNIRELNFPIQGGGMCEVAGMLAVAHYASTEIDIFDVDDRLRSKVSLSAVPGYVPLDRNQLIHPRTLVSVFTGVMSVCRGPYDLLFILYGNNPTEADVRAGKYQRHIHLAIASWDGKILGAVKLTDPLFAADPNGNLYSVDDPSNERENPVVHQWSFRAGEAP